VFVGVHERQLDPKGRLALPAAFRPRFEPRCFLTIGRDNCIDVLTEEAMEDMAKDLLDKVRRNEISRNEARAISSRSYEATIDAQGRINLEQTLRDYAGVVLGEKVIVSGSFDRVEIWEPSRYERNMEEGTALIAGAGA
jgi:MraZ protein